jgi:hypothetical protein
MPRVSFKLPSIMSRAYMSAYIQFNQPKCTFRADISEFYSSRCNKLKCFVYVLCLLHAHPRVAVIST